MMAGDRGTLGIDGENLELVGVEGVNWRPFGVVGVMARLRC